MAEPRSRAEQRHGRIRAEIVRGCGVMPYSFRACALEPPFVPFDRNSITAWDLAVNGWERPYQGTFWDRFKRFFLPVTVPAPGPFPYAGGGCGNVSILQVAPYPEDEVTLWRAEQFLLSLAALREPVAFELFGIGESRVRPDAPPAITVRFAADEEDLPAVLAQLQVQYPRSAFELWESWHDDEEWGTRLHAKKHEATYFAALYLPFPYCFPLRTYPKFDTDPLGVAIGVFEELARDEWVVIQILFQPCKEPWGENLRAALTHSYKPKHPVFEDFDLKTLDEKLAAPLFAVQVRLASNTGRVFEALRGWASQYESPENRLEVLDAARWAYHWSDLEPFPAEWHGEMLHFREAYWPGMILNARELVGLVHLPSPGITSERLVRQRTPTRRAPKPLRDAPLVVIGENVHHGEAYPVAIPPELRVLHCYIAGSSGMGKSTLLLNMILQDIAAGHGVGVLDPHGDLIAAVLRRIPKQRVEDVILFDPADEQWPFGLNILDAKASERERIVAETVMALERYFPSSWGPRLERILTYAIYTVLDAIPGATLADVERLLVDPAFRNEVVAKTHDPRFRQFWTEQFTFFPKNAVDPVLNKLSVFLVNPTVRNIVCQRRAAIDFDDLLNEGKILLANLSTGLLTERIAGTLGSFLVTKIANAALRRAAIPEHVRRPWFLYVDEFQAFMNLSVGFERILAEARKFKLVLAGLANQYVGQLSPPVRQAVFGNVGSMIVFRLGVEDADLVARQLGQFTAGDILNLERGQAIARVGGAATAFNVRTYPPPTLAAADPADEIVSRSRRSYARPRSAVEREIGELELAPAWAELSDRDQQEPVDALADDLVR